MQGFILVVESWARAMPDTDPAMTAEAKSAVVRRFDMETILFAEKPELS
jgi:hypothetical protein